LAGGACRQGPRTDQHCPCHAPSISSIAGSVTIFVLLFGPILLVLSPLVGWWAGGLVGWAHWRVGAPTVAQAVVTTILAVVITAGTFWLMRVPVAFLK
jgi:hypothetical protein